MIHKENEIFTEENMAVNESLENSEDIISQVKLYFQCNFNNN